MKPESIVSSYPLSSIQQGMLFHHIDSPHSGVDIEQMAVSFQEHLLPAEFQAAWAEIIQRHEALRTAFEWEGRDSAVQHVLAEIPIEWSHQDWRHLESEEQEQKWEAFLKADRLQGVDLKSPPLMRFALFHLGPDRWRFLWTVHHILVDGQSFSIILPEVFQVYDARCAGNSASLPESKPYRDYILWLLDHLGKTAPQAEAFWRDALKGFSSPTPLFPRISDTTETIENNHFDERQIRLSREVTAKLETFGRIHGLTLNTLVQAGWAYLLSRYSGHSDIVFGTTRGGRHTTYSGADQTVGLFINTIPLRIRVPREKPVNEWLEEVRDAQLHVRAFEHTPLVDIQGWSTVPRGEALFDSIVVFTKRLLGEMLRQQGDKWAHREIHFLEQTNYPLALFAYGEQELVLKIVYARERFDDVIVEKVLDQLKIVLQALPDYRDRVVGDLPLLSENEREVILKDWNNTETDYPVAACIHQLFERQVELTPAADALVFRDQTLSYAELNRRANHVAHRLQSLGIGPDSLVGIFVERSLEMVIGLLGILKAGAAYVPLDPAYPAERLAMMLEDSQAEVVLSQRRLADRLPTGKMNILCLDEPVGETPRQDLNPITAVTSENLAYVLFTSGSTGRPKGVMIRHRNAVNFFTGMDEQLEHRNPGVWLAVTSISFDISVLELFWTLTRGFKVILQEESAKTGIANAAKKNRGLSAAKPVQFSLFYFSSDAGGSERDRYRLLIEGAKFADARGFSAVWTPERHFHAFGGLFPNPAITSAAIATITQRVQIRAGSVVLPLHHPIRVAEEWSVVDNLSGGRVGLSFASGWHANDFALAPDNFACRKEMMFQSIETIRKLWKGEAIEVRNGTGNPIEVRMLPRPIQQDPPFWITAAGNIETFRMAGQLGANLLTNLLGQTTDELEKKIRAYRSARQESGHSGPGHVSLMLHTFIGSSIDEVRDLVRAPFTDYLRTSTDLIKKARWECPAFVDKSGKNGKGSDEDLGNELTEEQLEVVMDHAFERYFKTSGLFGTPESCSEMASNLAAIGVDEIACLLDFGVAPETVLKHLEFLDQLKERCKEFGSIAADDFSIPAQIQRHRVTHFQCTPSMARILALDCDTLDSLRPLQKLILGGEALPQELARQLGSVVQGDMINMYGPTETTVWSTGVIVPKTGELVTIGRPLANTQIYIVDEKVRPVPAGMPGELLIGGAGVASGYLQRPELTAEKFINNPFGTEGSSPLYRTGDLARCRADGSVEYLGRIDHQVKIRGHRIELGEIESVLEGFPGVHQAVVASRQDESGDQRLVAYVIPETGSDQSAENIEQWKGIWDETYKHGNGATQDPTFNIRGWKSSFTGEPIPEPEMREWLDGTVKRILAFKPKRVLEIGCGTGLILHRVASHCEHYCGVDFSEAALDVIRRGLEGRALSQVTLRQMEAHDFSSVEKNYYDLIILNSVAQYFPNVDYFVDVVGKALQSVVPGGHVFLGDIRSRPLLETFHAAVELQHASDALTVADFKSRLQKRLRQERELTIDPHLFSALAQQWPQITRVSVRLKRGCSCNEMLRFRYDTVLYICSGEIAPDIDECVTWSEDQPVSLEMIQSRLDGGPGALVVRDIPNPRLIKEFSLLDQIRNREDSTTIGEVRNTISRQTSTGLEPEDLERLDDRYEVELSWAQSGRLDAFDAVFYHRMKRGHAAPKWAGSSVRHWGDYANQPFRSLEPGALTSALRKHLEGKLPEIMQPSVYVVMDALPLTPNGKIDRKNLPAPPQEARERAQGFVAPRTVIEKGLAEIWAGALGVERIGALDNFFSLGGHSLSAIKIAFRISQEFNVEMPLQTFFRVPTLAALAEKVEELLLAQVDENDLNAIAEEVEHLTEEELQSFAMSER